MNIELATQPISDDIAEACGWLSAAERYLGQPLEERLDAGDVLNVLCDVRPPYPPIDMSRPAVPLTEATPVVIRALERAIEASGSAEQKLRAARALRRLRRGLV